ncbi:alkaline phosphatase PafA [Flavihumibacter profundi]|uniref:alkaline phosphatase PafA n=1 Tax=Flavihumibacter profundi TaxID=2716883 RepID=UPI001CC78358|nr:alkaline phosphatase PafA [Flavihumibacter profundi]MBZ5857161.1 alkaline phosphatase family protein [Flavihumibacter profundi]
MNRRILVLLFSFSLSVSFAQNSPVPLRPKLVVGLVVDQMRWDFLYRYSDRYKADGGFKRLLSQGFSNENTLIPYTPTITSCGHTGIYTGSVPAVHGIAGNTWYQRSLGRVVYCTEDKTVKTVGSSSGAGVMSPRNLLVTTIGDELRLATNFRSKVIGIAIKDRGAILPAGHSANGAYWYDNSSGKWITSSYYCDTLPAWLSAYNDKKVVDKFYQQGWNTLYPLNTYVNSAEDFQPYEGKPLGPEVKGFPYDLKPMIGKNYFAIAETPFGNTMALQVAKEAITAEALGKGIFTDMLTVSLSSTDYIGHTFGPNSVETEDCYLRLDADLGDFLNFLDAKVGKGQYLLFLSADHGVAHVPGFLAEHKIPAGIIDNTNTLANLNTDLYKQFGTAQMASNLLNNQVYLNHKLIDSLKLDLEKITRRVVDFMQGQPGIARAISLENLSQVTLPANIKEMVANGYMPDRSGDVQVVYLPQYMDEGATGTTHGLWNPYDAHIPLVWYGWMIKPGKSNQEVHMTDIAPTIAALLRIQMPNGAVGKPIETVTR